MKIETLINWIIISLFAAIYTVMFWFVIEAPWWLATFCVIVSVCTFIWIFVPLKIRPEGKDAQVHEQ